MHYAEYIRVDALFIGSVAYAEHILLLTGGSVRSYCGFIFRQSKFMHYKTEKEGVIVPEVRFGWANQGTKQKNMRRISKTRCVIE